jgi:hypothetical protein
MTRRPKNVQQSLFDEDAPHVMLAGARMAELAVLLEALLREIAAALANGEIGDEQDHD